MILVLLACRSSETPPADGPGDTSGPTAAVDVRPLADARGSVLGEPGSALGYGVDFAGDADADGRDDLVTAAYFAGQICLFSGASGPGTRTADALACYTAETISDYAGYALAGGRDATGDGQADVLVGAVGRADLGAQTGAIYLLSAPFATGPLTGAFATFGGEAAGDQAGTSAVFAGDVDDDGDEDLLLGAWGNDEGGLGGGKAYLVRGPIAAGSRSLAEADAAILGTGLIAERHGAPTEGDGCGSVLSGAGDFSGDGLGDIALGVNGSDVGGQEAGLVAVFFGPVPDGVRALADADRTFTGEGVQEYAGDNVVLGGDLDADGAPDLLAAGDMNSTGRVRVIPGGAPSGPLSALETTLEGGATGDLAGATLAGPGDLDGDGAADAVVGAYGADTDVADAGLVYVLYGPLPAGTLPLDAAPLRWTGEAELDSAGRGLAGGGDLDADGRPDLLVGAPYQGALGGYGGAAYLLATE